MTGHTGYLDEFIDAWRELDALYLELLSLALWPREARRWEKGWLEHARARRETPPTPAAFEDAARQWRAEARKFREELERLRRSTPDQRARALDPWSRLRRTGPREGTGEPGGPGAAWPGWRQRLWRRALEADLDLPRPLLPAELEEAEQQLGIRLPSGYREFLLEVAAGTPTGLPVPGIAPLVRGATGRWSWDGIGTRTHLDRLAEPFPEREIDGPPGSGEPDDGDDREDDDGEDHGWEDDDWDEESPEEALRAELTPGAVCLHSLGCGDALWLVVTGRASGRMWADYLDHGAGFGPHLTRGGVPSAFSSWVRDAAPH